MLTEFIKRLLEREREYCSNREEELTMPHVIDEKDSKNKYDSDIEALKLIYGVHFSTGLTIIETSLQDILRICPRERKRADAYTGLASYLKKKFGITLIITSNKTKKGDKNEI